MAWKRGQLNRAYIRQLMEERGWSASDLFAQLVRIGSKIGFDSIKHITQRRTTSDCLASTLYDLRDAFGLESMDQLFMPSPPPMAKVPKAKAKKRGRPRTKGARRSG